MLQIKLILNSTRDGEPNNDPPLSEDKILRALSFFCKVQSSLSRDEIISLYERVGTITKCLLHFDIEDDASPLQPLAARLCDPDTSASSFPSQFIDPSLITLDKGPRDHPKTTSFTSPDLDRSHLPAQSGARALLSEPPSSPFDEGVRRHCTSGAFNKDKPPPFENANVIPTTHGSVGHDENDFDSVFREIDKMDASGQSLNVRQGPRGCTTEPESSTCPPGGETGQEIERVDSDGDDPMTSQPRTQISDSNRDERICHDISVGNIQERSHEMATAGFEEYSHRASPDNTTCENQEQSAEASVVTPGPGTAIPYSTPDSKTPNTPMPASKRLKRFEEVTSGRGFLPSPSQTPSPASGSPDRTPNTCESGRLSALQPTVEHAHDDTELGDTGNESSDHDGFEDSEIQSVLKEAHKFLQATSSTPEMTSEAPEGAIKASSRNIDVTPENGLDLTRGSPSSSSILSSSINFDEAHPAASHEDVGNSDDDFSNSRKRKLDVASLEEHAGSTPSTMSSLSDALSDDAGSESAASSSPPAEDDEDENDMDSEDLPRPESRQASTVSEQSTEEMDEIMAYEPDIPGSVFSKLTGQQAGEVRRIGDHLLLRNLACFLGTYSRAWKAAGFWSASSWTTTQPSSIVSRPNRAGLMTYLVGLHNDNAVHDVKVRIARVSLFLFFEREIECERRRGTEETALKRNAVSKLCNSSGLGPVEKRKLHKSFHNEKKIGEFWWWCVHFFGPSFLVRCSKEAGKKINNGSRFPLDAMIAYVLHENPLPVKPYPALDEAVVRLLISGDFPEEFSRQDVQMWEQSTATGSLLSPAWRPFSAEAVTREALANLEKWATNPDNRLLTF